MIARSLQIALHVYNLGIEKSRAAYNAERAVFEARPADVHVRGMADDDPRHGTRRGYNAHLYYDEHACEPCRAAYAAWWRQRRAERKSA